MSTSCLHVAHLGITLGEREILHDVSFDVRSGEFCCLIGPNGAGKSTLLKCVDCLLDGWQGEIRLEGTTVKSLSRRTLSQRVGYVPQFRESAPHFVVEDFLFMSGYAQEEGTQLESSKIEEALERVGMQDFRHRSMDTLSGGECQKIFIAAGLVQDTPLLLLDEPTAFLDPRYQQEINEVLIRLCREKNVTILCVSHDVNSALLYGDRLVGLKNGRVQFSQTPAQLSETDQLASLFGVDFAYAEHPHRTDIRMVLPQGPQGMSRP